jgi:hypothetical protein
LLVEAAQVEFVVTRTLDVNSCTCDTSGTADRKGGNCARLAVRLYWRWRKPQDYQQLSDFGSHAGQLELVDCVK